MAMTMSVVVGVQAQTVMYPAAFDEWNGKRRCGSLIQVTD